MVHGVTDLLPERLHEVVYVDSGPTPDGAALSPDLDPAAVEIPLPSWTDLETSGSSLPGFDEAMLAEFRERAAPHPAGPARDPMRLVNPARRQVPVTRILPMVGGSSDPGDVEKLLV